MNNYKKLSFGKDENGRRIQQDEHRYIMEQYLGRKLKNNEVVHHKDGNKQNNEIENLQVMTLSEHSKLHSKDRKISEETRKKLSEINKHKIGSCRNKDRQDIINIVLKYKELKNYRAVDRYFNLYNGTTGNIIRGKIYYDYQDLINKLLVD